MSFIVWLIVGYLLIELAYAFFQRLAVSRGDYKSLGAWRFLTRFFEPLRENIIQRESPLFYVRDVDHPRTGSILMPGGRLHIELLCESLPSQMDFFVEPILHRISYDHVARKPILKPIHAFQPINLRQGLMKHILEIPDKLESGMYILEFRNPAQQRIALTLFVTQSASVPSRGAVILPTFTIWGYDERSGFYPGHERPSLDLWMHRVAKTSLAGWVLVRLTRLILPSLGIHTNQMVWPIHRAVRMDSFYRTNHRWSKWLWDRSLADLEGVWNDDIDILVPFFALAEKHNCRFRIYSDLDLHRHVHNVFEEDRWVFIGQESLTSRMWTGLEQHISDGKVVVLWCPQGFGYREVEFDEMTNTLTYICSRGKRGFWNEVLESREPSWSEGTLLGFHFPSPDSDKPTNPHKVQYSTLVVKRPVQGKDKRLTVGEKFTYRLWDGRTWRSGLNWMGGEPFRRVEPGADILVAVGEDEEVIGVGKYRNVTIVSPTFLGALWAYVYPGDCLIESIFESVILGDCRS